MASRAERRFAYYGVGIGPLVGIGVTIMMGVGPEAGGAGRSANITKTSSTVPKLITSSNCDRYNQSSFFSTIDSYFCLICCQAAMLISLRLTSRCILGTNTCVAQIRLNNQQTMGRKKRSKTRLPGTGKLNATICLRRSLNAKTAK